MAYRMIYYSGASEADQATCQFIMRSSVDGLSWSGEAITLDESPTYNTLGPCLTKLSDGRLLLAYNRLTREPTVKIGVFYRFSSDNGLTWGDAAQIVTSYANEAEGGPIIELADGRLCCPFWDASGGQFDAVVIFSDDDGATWESEAVIGDGSADVRDYTETNLIEYEAGKILALIRCTTDNKIYQSVSLDNGATWSDPVEVFTGRSAVRMCKLSNGWIVGYLRSNGELPVIVCTQNNGGTWSAQQTLLSEKFAHYGDVVELPGDRVGVAYSVNFDEVADAAIFWTVLDFADLPA